MDKFYPKSIEDLAKNAFEKADDLPNQLPDWDKMNALLNQEMPQKTKKRRIIFWFFIFLILGIIITGSYIFYNDSRQLKPTNLLRKSNVAPSDSTKYEVNIPANIPQQDIVKSAELSQQTLANPRGLKQQKINASENFSQAQTPKPIIIDSLEFDSASLTNKKILQPETVIHSSPSQNSTKEQIKISDSSKLILIDTTSVVPEKIAIKKMPSRWEWNFSVAPDFLLANIQPLHQPGFSLGVGINYVLNPKFRIRSGLLYNYTTVEASGEGYIYKPSPNLPAYSSLELKYVKGNLHVFEVPLSLRYTAAPTKNWSFIGSAGLSSLFFIKQQYTYDLLLNGNTPLLWNSANDTDDDGESHILNNLTLGLGISIKTKKNAVMEIEPMFKLPLEELGEGHTKLGTIAIYFNLRMPINTKNK